MAKPVGPEVPKLDVEKLRPEKAIRRDLAEQLERIDQRFAAWGKNDASGFRSATEGNVRSEGRQEYLRDTGKGRG